MQPSARPVPNTPAANAVPLGKPLALAVHLAAAGLLATGFPAAAMAQAAPGSQPGAADAAPTLPAITVRSDRTGSLATPYAGGQVARGSRVGLLGDLGVMDTPFSAISYTSEYIQNQQAATVADVIRNDSSVRMTGQSGDLLDSFFIRGFPVGDQNSGEIAFDGVYGVAPNYRVLTDYAERIEIVKGPSALLYGLSPAGSIGGVVNVVPKRAGAVDLTRFTVDYASTSQVGGHVDLSRRFGADRQIGMRVNASHHQGDTALDRQERKADVGALALDYQGECRPLRTAGATSRSRGNGSTRTTNQRCCARNSTWTRT